MVSFSGTGTAGVASLMASFLVWVENGAEMASLLFFYFPAWLLQFAVAWCQFVVAGIRSSVSVSSDRLFHSVCLFVKVCVTFAISPIPS
jgi:hypothetical protein